jgi:biotin operon repressor
LPFAPRSGHLTNHSKLSYILKTQYYISLNNREQIINFGQKPKKLPLSRRAWAKDMRRLKFYDEGLFVLDEARRYQEYLERKDVNTKAEIAEIFGVSRARVTQHLNLLKLTKQIIKFLYKNKENSEVRKYFTERRLRPLTWIDKKEQCIVKK